MSGEVRPLYLSDQDSAIREYAFETQTFVVSSSMYMPESAVPDDFPFKKTAAWKWAMGGSAIANPFGAYVCEPVFHREELVVGELDPRDRIVAKNVFDCMGHYSRWDVVSLRLNDEDCGPTGPTRPRRIRWEQLERVAEKHALPPEKLEAIARDLEGLAVEVEG
jgi:amidase/nitrilase